MEDKWRKQMQRKMEGHERPLPDLSWDELNRALAANKRPRMTVVWGRRIAAAAAIVIVVVGGAVYYSKVDVDAPKFVAVTGNGPTDADKVLDGNVGDGNVGDGNVGPLCIAAASKAKTKYEAGRQPSIAAAIYNGPAGGHKRGDDKAREISVEPFKEKNSELPVEPHRKDKTQDIYKPINETPPAGGQGGLIASVYTQNAFNNTSDGMRGMTYLPYGDADSEFSNGTNGILENNAPKSVTYDHNFPIKVGVGLRYRIDKRWSIATGLTYSYLSSTYEASEKGDHWTGKQSLHYVGLPLAVSYNVFASRRLSLYVTVGGEMQKLVSGKSADNGTDISETVRERRLQWSLNAAAGAQYNFTGNIGVYIEPGIVHYIDNGSAVENYYKYKPTNFDLSLGLRLDL